MPAGTTYVVRSSRFSTSKPPVVQPATEPPAIAIPTLARLTKWQHFARFCFVIGCLWNAAAPLKAWFLSRYGFVPTTTTTIVNLNWDTVLNGKFLTQLYTNAGIPLSKPLTATRYLNVFTDFKILPRSIATWAGSYAGTETVYQMDLDGRPLRRSLDGAAEVAAFNAALPAFTTSGFNLWGAERIYSYVPPTTAFGSLQDVAEAVLCLKGMSLETFVNVQYKSSLNPLTSPSDAAAMAMWRTQLFPHLTSCLARRATLIASAATPAAGVVALAKELASTYNLSLANIAGTKQLFAPTTFLDGFIDISGQSSGAATYEISGRDLFATALGGSGYINSIFAPRETAWWCSIQYVDPATNAPNRTQCFERMAVSLPAFFVGKYIALNSGSRYIDNADVVPSTTIGNLQSYHYKHHDVQPLTSVHLATLGNRTTWAALIPEVIATVAQKPVDTSDAIEELCFVGDGCFAACLNETASGGTTYTYRRGGECVTTIDTVTVSLNELYVDLACLGLGTGTSHVRVTYINSAGIRSTRVASTAASPMAILACIVGGRIPNGDSFPSNFIDMVSRGTEVSLVVTSSNGSEAIMLNFIALISLLGYIFYLLWIVLYLVKTDAWIRRLPPTEHKMQLRFSMAKCNVSSVVWMIHRNSMRITGFLGLVAWHVGASDCHCNWNSSSDVRIDPIYGCSNDPTGHFRNFSEWIRLLSYAWVFFALVYMDLMPGIGSNLKGYATAVIMLSLLPLALWAYVIGELWRLRAQWSWLTWMHSQLFLILFWLAVCVTMRSRVTLPYMRLVDWCLYRIGMRKQSIDRKSPFRTLIGTHFWTPAALFRPEDIAYVPMSVLLKTKGIVLENIVDHTYFTYGVDTDLDDESRKPRTHPDWVLAQPEYYVCVAT
ncbi:hypothetical protein SDRG_15793 [Saprolegnia diclina VS20]|uniref:Uncharacterized protein n=1 Tax=Saprolegnia diclina (strain VS20) TaxID=1156394 RepID=T0RA34_SAPDV|nr:hypothetical protein SDRG_15793 [Saprolegnia diclina VS20]EQC26382.1 hypothetical protein SDRG_15793 [Saprolegnia diclina VS20]|eukprot:XP_008620197.1 hypothetical protein SDRG_15793 [Saprolegnia diclina VS20]